MNLQEDKHQNHSNDLRVIDADDGYMRDPNSFYFCLFHSYNLKVNSGAPCYSAENEVLTVAHVSFHDASPSLSPYLLLCTWAFTAGAPPTSLLFLGHARCSSASGPLVKLFPLPGMPYSLTLLLQYSPLSEFTDYST
jgi:hypothetical protein